jgi:hypothetical protein
LSSNVKATIGHGDEKGWRVTAADRAALLRKYQLLAKWRRARDGQADGAGGLVDMLERGALRALAIEFPGALRELDVLGLPEISRRIEDLRQPARQRPAEGDAWIAWIAAYHALMRAALVTKRASGRARRLRTGDIPALVRAASMAAGVPVDEEFLRTVARPRGGRVGVVILDALAVRFRVPATRISTTLFPTRRPSPYSFPT